MRETTFRIEQFTPYDHEKIVKRLNRMSMDGWLLERPGNLFWKYRKVEPKKRHFAVTYLPNASDFDPGPTEGENMMTHFAAQDGWTLLGKWGQIFIFYSDKEDPVPIETDALIQVNTIHRAMKKGMLLSYYTMLGLSIYQIFFSFVRMWDDPVAFLSTPMSLYTLPTWFFIMFAEIAEIFQYYQWYHKALKIAEETGTFFSANIRHTLTWILVGMSTVFIVVAFWDSAVGISGALTGLLSVLIIGWMIRKLSNRMKKKGFSRRWNFYISIGVAFFLAIAIIMGMGYSIFRFETWDTRTSIGTYTHNGWTMEIYDDPLPLYIEDLQKTDAAFSKEASHQETVLLARAEYKQNSLGQGPDLQYTVIDCKVPYIKSVIHNSLLSDRNNHKDPKTGEILFYDMYLPIADPGWNADAVYQKYWSSDWMNAYLVCWDNRILEITFYWEPTKEEIAIAAEKLMPIPSER